MAPKIFHRYFFNPTLSLINSFQKDWRLAYIKLTYHQNILDCAFNRLFGVVQKANLSTLSTAFKLLKEHNNQKSNVIKITLVTSNRKTSASSVEPRMSERKSANSPSQNKSRERFTKSPRIAPTHRSKPSLNTTPNSNRQPSKRAQSPRRVEAYSINLMDNSGRKSHNNASGRRSYNQSVSPAPSSRRQSDYSPGKRDSIKYGLSGSNRPSVNKSPGCEKTMSRMSARDSVYSIVGK